MIELTDARYAYAKGGFALHVQDHVIEEGERCCWVGPSGSGKTTLLHLVAGIFRPESGRVRVFEKDLAEMSDSARRDFRIANIGLVFQDFALLDYLNVLNNILLPYRISHVMQQNDSVRSRAIQLANSLGLEDLLERRPVELSQGEKQRVAVCRAIVARPKLVLADEPTANLDAANSERVLNSLETYASESGATLIIVSHDREVIERFSDTTDVSEFCSTSKLGAAKAGEHV